MCKPSGIPLGVKFKLLIKSKIIIIKMIITIVIMITIIIIHSFIQNISPFLIGSNPP